MVTREPTPMSELLADKSTKGGNSPQSGGSAWAALTAPGAGPIWDKTAVEDRFDPNQDSSKLGTAISKQVPLSDQYSLMAVERLERHPAGHHAGARHSRPGRRAAMRPINPQNSRPATPAPASPPARACRRAPTNGSAKSAPRKSCSTASPSPARSAKPRKALTNKSISAGLKKSW